MSRVGPDWGKKGQVQVQTTWESKTRAQAAPSLEAKFPCNLVFRKASPDPGSLGHLTIVILCQQLTNVFYGAHLILTTP